MLAFIQNHGTKIIGAAQGTVAAIAAVDGVIPQGHLKYWMAASAVLVVWRGFVNSSKQVTNA